jgi:hypothetical protein
LSYFIRVKDVPDSVAYYTDRVAGKWGPYAFRMTFASKSHATSVARQLSLDPGYTECVVQVARRGDCTTYTVEEAWKAGTLVSMTAEAKSLTVREPLSTSPNYYRVTVDGLEIDCIDLINALAFNFNRGCALKYLWRAGRKVATEAGDLEDLKKAKTCIEREIARLEQRR